MFKHYIKFISLPDVGTIEIAESIGFDKASYKVKQDDRRFGRDIIIANEDTELTFSRDFFETLSMSQTLPSGEVINNASMGFDYLLDIFKNEGWEGKLEYIIQKDDVTFSTGIFSYATAMVEFDNIKVKIIQNTNREIIKRLEDTDVNAFSDKALDGRTIDACGTVDILLKAKPIYQQSLWETSSNTTYISGGAGGTFNRNINIISAIKKQEIQNSLSYLIGYGNRADFIYIKALNQLSNVNINIKINIDFSQSAIYTASSANLILRYYIGNDAPPSNAINLYSTALGNATGLFVNINQEINLTNLSIPTGYSLYIWFNHFVDTGNNPYVSGVKFNECSINVTATSTSIDTVVKGVRLIDLVRHNVKSLADVEVIAPEYDVNGEHYNNFAFNGLLLGQITDKPFNNKFKDLMNVFDETCSDYQINPNSVEILPYKDYYTDVEMADFEELPSYASTNTYNKRYTLKTADFKYKKSSSERETNGENTIDDVHTETQKFITDSVDSNLKVEIDHIRSAFLIEEARGRAFDNEETKSLQNDDSLFLLKCVPLAPSTQGGFTANLLMRQKDASTLEILNNNTDGDGINFNWTLLGFGVASTFYIDSGQNVGVYTVAIITTSVLTLTRVSGTLNYTGDAFVKLRWFYTNVVWTNQTNEGYALIEGVSNPQDYSNLDYSWGRNIKRWYPYLATATKFKPNGVIKTASFKTNGDLVTKKSQPFELVNTVDSAEIINANISSLKILNPNVHSIKVYSDFDKTTQLIEDLQTQKGYITVRLNDGRNIKGHIKELDYSWVKEELDLELEERFEGDFMNITSSGITYPQYESKTGLYSFQINNIFVLLFSENENQLYPPVRFTNIKINGVQYTDIVEFTNALTDLINE